MVTHSNVKRGYVLRVDKGYGCLLEAQRKDHCHSRTTPEDPQGNIRPSFLRLISRNLGNIKVRVSSSYKSVISL